MILMVSYLKHLLAFYSKEIHGGHVSYENILRAIKCKCLYIQRISPWEWHASSTIIRKAVASGKNKVNQQHMVHVSTVNFRFSETTKAEFFSKKSRKQRNNYKKLKTCFFKSEISL